MLYFVKGFVQCSSINFTHRYHTSIFFLFLLFILFLILAFRKIEPLFILLLLFFFFILSSVAHLVSHSFFFIPSSFCQSSYHCPSWLKYIERINFSRSASLWHGLVVIFFLFFSSSPFLHFMLMLHTILQWWAQREVQEALTLELSFGEYKRQENEKERERERKSGSLIYRFITEDWWQPKRDLHIEV